MWNKHKTSIIVFTAILALLFAFWYMPSFAFVFFLSLLLTLLLLDPVDRLSKKIPRFIAALLVLISFLVLSFGLIAVVSSSFVPTLYQFTDELPELAAKIQQMNNWTESGLLKKALDDAWAELSSISTQAIKSSVVLVFSLFNKMIDFVIIVFLTFYFLIDGDKVKIFVASLFPEKDNQRITDLMNKILMSLRVYIRSQLTICLITGIIVYLYFTIMDLPYGSVFAVTSAVCEFIPVLGPTVASGFGILMTVIAMPDLTLPTALFYLCLTQINHNAVYPAIVGKSLHLHPIAIILGIILGGELLNAAGMFLAVPFIVVIKHVIADINTHSHII